MASALTNTNDERAVTVSAPAKSPDDDNGQAQHSVDCEDSEEETTPTVAAMASSTAHVSLTGANQAEGETGLSTTMASALTNTNYMRTITVADPTEFPEDDNKESQPSNPPETTITRKRVGMTLQQTTELSVIDKEAELRKKRLKHFEKKENPKKVSCCHPVIEKTTSWQLSTRMQRVMNCTLRPILLSIALKARIQGNRKL
jgi:hypothetical protein